MCREKKARHSIEEKKTMNGWSGPFGKGHIPLMPIQPRPALKYLKEIQRSLASEPLTQ